MGRPAIGRVLPRTRQAQQHPRHADGGREILCDQIGQVDACRRHQHPLQENSRKPDSRREHHPTARRQASRHGGRLLGVQTSRRLRHCAGSPRVGRSRQQGPRTGRPSANRIQAHRTPANRGRRSGRPVQNTMSKWKETNKYGIRESKAAYWRYTRRMNKEAEILKELEPQPPTHVDLTGLETYIQRLRESKEPTMDDNYLIWFDVETSGLDPMSDNLLEVEARITDMKGLQVPFADDPLIFHRVIRFDDNTPIRAFNSTTIDMHSRNGLIGECMNAEDTLKNVDKQMAVWLIDTGLDPGLMHPAGTNVHFDIRWLDVNMPNTSGILHKLSHRRLDLTSFRLLRLARVGDPYDCVHEPTHRTTDCLNRDIFEYKTIINQQGQ
nr:MAG TPA: Oligoribonuclease [Caudoviricetes sp.]